MAEHRALSGEPLLLALESATAVASVAILRGERVLARRRSRPGRPHSETLLPLVDEVLAELATDLGQIGAFAVSIGPGAFTGLRIGLATLKGLAFGGAQPVASVSTLEALALVALRERGARGAPEVVAATLDARRGEVYAAAYRSSCSGSAAEMEPALEEGVYTPEQLLQGLPAGALLAGEGVAVLGVSPSQLAAAGVRVEPGPCSVPDAAAVGILGLRELARGRSLRAERLVPRYLRRAEAEVVRTAKRFE